MKKVVEISELDFHYHDQENLLTNLSLELRTGKIYGLLGKKAEGKSTLLKLICGLLFPNNGKIESNEFIPSERNVKMMQNIYFLPEEIFATSLSIEAFEKVYAPFYPGFSSSNFYENMNTFLIDTKTSNLAKLKEAQKKKFHIAFALSTNARIILLDEPTQGLDQATKIQFRKMVSSTISNDCCIIISTDLAEDLEDLLDTVIILDEHKIALFETKENITQKLVFEISETKKSNQSYIYCEETEIANKYLSVNSSREAGKLDAGLLFDAFLSNKESIIQLLKQP